MLDETYHALVAEAQLDPLAFAQDVQQHQRLQETISEITLKDGQIKQMERYRGIVDATPLARATLSPPPRARVQE